MSENFTELGMKLLRAESEKEVSEIIENSHSMRSPEAWAPCR